MKTFLEEPAILDKFKAAAVIANGKFVPGLLAFSLDKLRCNSSDSL